MIAYSAAPFVLDPACPVCTYLLVQLVIAVIIENIEMQSKIDSMAITQKHMQVQEHTIKG